ncbi:MAG: aminopeptidase [Pirellulaceae bacterium]|nr:aminopeptidase [Pirellulaceae bacterium]
MRDPRIDNLADVLVGYSTEVKKGDLVLISGPPLTSPLVSAIYRQVVSVGGHPVISMQPEECKEILLTEGSEQQLTFEDPVAQFQIENIDVLIAIWGQTNSKALTEVSPERQAKVSQARKRYLDTYLKRAADGQLRWVGTQFPCNSSAQDAEMSLASYENFVFHAGLLDRDRPAEAWRAISEQQQHLVEFLNGKKELRFVTPQGTDLKLDVSGRRWLNCDGHENFPDGEVFTGPVEDATEGVVRYSFPAVHGGREVNDICFTFKHGKVVEATASKGEEFLHAMLDQDAGARVLGEIAIGTNYSITEYTKNTLFDEKIGGTFHAAVGSSYPESGGKNQSGLHWDMVCDLRQGGKIFVDGELISENGKFLNPAFPQPLA